VLRPGLGQEVDLKRRKSLRDGGSDRFFAIGNRDSLSVESDRPRTILQVGAPGKGVVVQRAPPTWSNGDSPHILPSPEVPPELGIGSQLDVLYFRH
jgi:hypothetical protein